jgi:hypothetical protein
MNMTRVVRAVWFHDFLRHLRDRLAITVSVGRVTKEHDSHLLEAS